MDKNERQKIYTLLSKYYPRARQLKDAATLTAWGYVLEKYTYDDVKNSVINYAASNKYFPDPSDITGGLTPIPNTSPEPERRDLPMGEKERRCLERSIHWQQEWHDHLRALGLPTFREATMGGMDPGEYNRLLCSKGAFDG
ncbi:MAG: hypothetical protein ACI3V3_04155 [Faecousia sp.]